MYKLCDQKTELYQFKLLKSSFHTCEAMHRKQDRKSTVSSDIRKKRNNPRNFKN